MDRTAYIEGLNVEAMMPADIEVFVRMLPRRMPRSAREEQVELLAGTRRRVVEMAVAVGAPDASRLDPADIDAVVETIVGHMTQLKRRQWKSGKSGDRLLDVMRASIAEISADLHELAGH